jgi:hypothetical protein
VDIGLLRLELKKTAQDQKRLKAASELANNRLYVCLEGNWSHINRDEIQERLHFIYDELATHKPNLDARVMLPAPGKFVKTRTFFSFLI